MFSLEFRGEVRRQESGNWSHGATLVVKVALS